MKLGGRPQGEGRWKGEHCGPEVPDTGDGGAAACLMLEGNRERFVTFLREHDLLVANTLFKTGASGYGFVPGASGGVG